MLFLGDTLIQGTDENRLILDETQEVNDSMTRRLEKLRILLIHGIVKTIIIQQFLQDLFQVKAT